METYTIVEYNGLDGMIPRLSYPEPLDIKPGFVQYDSKADARKRCLELQSSHEGRLAVVQVTERLDGLETPVRPKRSKEKERERYLRRKASGYFYVRDERRKREDEEYMRLLKSLR